MGGGSGEGESRVSSFRPFIPILVFGPVLVFALPYAIHFLVDLQLRSPPQIDPRAWGAVQWSGAALGAGGIAWALYGLAYVLPAGGRHFAHVPHVITVGGPYRLHRSPIYFGVVLSTIGQSVLYSSLAVLAYSAILFAAFNVVLVRVEEPKLRAAFGPLYDHYRSEVPRWLPLGPRRS